ncbi:YnbE family lipoprotein [Zavarzinia sp. CC-PAN008]|uniref:YnbE family lipoprotein n=1 Tax=Zavarzinia sp. CC-PAN008 TaxID=3243332 RepID=UPI003F746163
MARVVWGAPPAGKLARVGIVALAIAAAACNPTVKVEAPDKPIVINLNVKIEQEIRVKVEKDVQDLLQQRQDIF